MSKINYGFIGAILFSLLCWYGIYRIIEAIF